MFVQFASIHSCNNFTGTQQHNRPLLSTTSVFLVVLFRQDAWFPAQTATSSYTQQNARFLFRPPRKRPNAYFYFLQSVFSIFRTVRQRTTLSFSLRLPSMCVHPAMIHLTSLGPAHTGRSRLPPHRSSCSETKCWRRNFWRWARSPIRLGPICSCAVHSTLKAVLPMYPAARVLYSVVSGNSLTPSRQHLLSEGHVVVCARFRSHSTLLRRSRCKRHKFTRSLQTEE